METQTKEQEYHVLVVVEKPVEIGANQEKLKWRQFANSPRLTQFPVKPIAPNLDVGNLWLFDQENERRNLGAFLSILRDFEMAHELYKIHGKLEHYQF